MIMPHATTAKVMPKYLPKGDEQVRFPVLSNSRWSRTANLSAMSPPYIAPVIDSTAIFQADIFKGKVLFCTGGGSGICREMTEAMMRHGTSAVIVGRSLGRITQTAKELSDSTSQICIPAQADVRKPEQVQDAVAKAIEKFGRIDFVICASRCGRKLHGYNRWYVGERFQDCR
jgi:hypothetical protein